MKEREEGDTNVPNISQTEGKDSTCVQLHSTEKNGKLQNKLGYGEQLHPALEELKNVFRS